MENISSTLCILALLVPGCQGFTNEPKHKIIVDNCARDTDTSPKEYFPLRSHGDPFKWPLDGFCKAYTIWPHVLQNYVVEVEIKNVIGNSNRNFGHPGIMFNIKNCNNFDFIYFRPQSHGGCLQIGSVTDNIIRTSRSTSCATGVRIMQNGRWFKAALSISGKTVSVRLNDRGVYQYQMMHPGNGQAGVVIANGYDNLVHFRKFKVRRQCAGVGEEETPGGDEAKGDNDVRK